MTSPLTEIVRRVGGDIFAGGTRALVPGPGHSPGDRSLSLWMSGSRLVWHSFAGDPADAIRAHLGIERAAPASAEERRQAERERREAEAQRRSRAWRFCEATWAQTQLIEGTPAEAYLRGRRLAPPLSTELRFHRAAPLDYEARRTSPAMVGLVRSSDGRCIGLHVTAIKHDGSGKALGDFSRRMFGPVQGGAVRLMRVGEPGILAIGEGIETSLAFASLHGIPTWSALSTSGLRGFIPPLGLRELIIAADADEAGLGAAETLAARYRSRLPVRIQAPPAGDWNDQLFGGVAA